MALPSIESCPGVVDHRGVPVRPFAERDHWFAKGSPERREGILDARRDDGEDFPLYQAVSLKTAQA